jgi:hypothetical protein
LCFPGVPTVFEAIGGELVAPGTPAPGVSGPSAFPSSSVVVSVPPPLPLSLDAQLDVVMVLVSKVTAPFRASSLPWIVAEVLAVMLAKAITVPTKRVPVPSVADDPTCQNTLHACAPLTRETVVFEPVINVEPIWNMNTALGSP